MAEQRFKMILMWSCKKNVTYAHNFGCTNKGYLLQKHIKMLWQWINFYAIYSTNKYSDSQKNFNFLQNNLIDNGTTMKTKYFQEQQEENNWKSEHMLRLNSHCNVLVLRTGGNFNNLYKKPVVKTVFVIYTYW